MCSACQPDARIQVGRSRVEEDNQEILQVGRLYLLWITVSAMLWHLDHDLERSQLMTAQDGGTILSGLCYQPLGVKDQQSLPCRKRCCRWSKLRISLQSWIWDRSWRRLKQLCPFSSYHACWKTWNWRIKTLTPVEWSSLNIRQTIKTLLGMSSVWVWSLVSRWNEATLVKSKISSWNVCGIVLGNSSTVGRRLNLNMRAILEQLYVVYDTLLSSVKTYLCVERHDVWSSHLVWPSY